jgi:agmatine deiminase
MITDSQTNTVYFSNLIPEDFSRQFKELSGIIEGAGYKVKLLAETYDYYCRDYMPVQVTEDDYVQFVFRPKTYFKPSEYSDITNPVLVELTNNLTQSRYSPLILDGGNAVKSESKVIITDRVFKDNLFQFESEEDIFTQLEKDLQCQIIVVPEYPGELTGHADGLVRFIDEDTVFINETEGEKEKEWLRSFLRVLNENQLLHIKVPCPVVPDQENANGLYINYLHVGNLIVVPQFNMKEDKVALHTYHEFLGSRFTIVPFNARWIAEHGGVFNCASWTVKEQKS